MPVLRVFTDKGTSGDLRGTKIKVDNLHYELSKEDLEVAGLCPTHCISPLYADGITQGLFSKIGPVLKVELVYDRAGRSEGTAFVIYESSSDAREAVREFDGANAKGTYRPHQSRVGRAVHLD